MPTLLTPSKIGFVTSAEHRNLVADDLLLAAALQRRRARVVPVVWTETPPRETGCDLLVLRSCWDYHLKPQEFLSWVDEAHKHVPVINSPEMVRWNMDKHYLAGLQSAGFVVPKTLFLEQGVSANLEELMDQELIEAVIKPTISASAFETYRVRRQDAGSFNERLSTLLNERSMLVQEFVGEIETGGEWSLVYVGGEFSHAVHKLPRSGDFRVQHEHGGTYRKATPPEELSRMASRILERFAPEALYCRADMVLRSQGPTLMELELIEPLLHFELAPAAAEHMAELLMQAQARTSAAL
jgi:glutathione synthase/RimK-type ligase-like ATP-grasp enzyme